MNKEVVHMDSIILYNDDFSVYLLQITMSW
jgi:hypothetical protein